eukprot:TRINITY_DN50848_c0_g1_i1.p1 TRINITY_DN50848_c0_g1~~TRINITY_DN50848_c0_g1_i1.p1  ORF type:complete len:273 (+),score=22.27 TRINITY_DN50848_c0_g1_i1:89-907(+)
MPRRAPRHETAVAPPPLQPAICVADRRPFHRKAGYLGHVPRFASCRSGMSGSCVVNLRERVGSAETRQLFRQFYPFPSRPVRDDPSGSMVHEQYSAGASPHTRGNVSVWSLSEVPRETQEFPHSPPRRPVPARHIVGFAGHRAGAQFIAGETFTQEELITNPGSPQAAGRGYEPNKEFAKGRTLQTHAGQLHGTSPRRWVELAPRLPGCGGGPALLRASRRPQSAPAHRSLQGTPASLAQRRSSDDSERLVYPILRGPTRVRPGGHDVFLSN